jgi:hypothetical protein
LCSGCRVVQRSSMSVGQAADQALALTFSERDRQTSRLGGSLASGENHLGDATAKEAPEVELRASAKLVQLKCAELGQRLVFGELARNQPAQNVSHSPARTSRMRCQWVPAQ